MNNFKDLKKDELVQKLEKIKSLYQEGIKILDPDGICSQAEDILNDMASTLGLPELVFGTQEIRIEIDCAAPLIETIEDDLHEWILNKLNVKAEDITIYT